MKHKSIISKAKSLGLKVETTNDFAFYIEANGKVLQWYKQGDGCNSIHYRRADDITDLMTDYFAGGFSYTMKHAFSYITSN